jgi:hypothetical protein
MATPVLPVLKLSTPLDQREYQISEAPAMPALRIDVTLTGGTMGSSPIQWRVRLTFAGSETPYGKAGTAIDFQKNTAGAALNLQPADWPKLRGGLLTVTATAVVQGRPVTATLDGLRIVGKNPSEAAIRQRLGVESLRRIARQESGMKQFGSDNWPYFSRDGMGGADLGQITPAIEDQRWNWRANADAMITKFNQTTSLAHTYQSSVRNSMKFAELVRALNWSRAKAKLHTLFVTLPPWTADQLTRDAIRGYNGWAGNDPVVAGLHLHEYKLGVTAQGELKVVILGNGTTALAVWDPVPVADRPRIGDPDYVAHVLSQSP